MRKEDVVIVRCPYCSTNGDHYCPADRDTCDTDTGEVPGCIACDGLGVVGADEDECPECEGSGYALLDTGDEE